MWHNFSNGFVWMIEREKKSKSWLTNLLNPLHIIPTSRPENSRTLTRSTTKKTDKLVNNNTTAFDHNPTNHTFSSSTSTRKNAIHNHNIFRVNRFSYSCKHLESSSILLFFFLVAVPHGHYGITRLQQHGQWPPPCWWKCKRSRSWMDVERNPLLL